MKAYEPWEYEAGEAMELRRDGVKPLSTAVESGGRTTRSWTWVDQPSLDWKRDILRGGRTGWSLNGDLGRLSGGGMWAVAETFAGGRDLCRGDLGSGV